MIAVIPVEGGQLCLGGDEAVAEAGGRCLLIGDGVVAAFAQLDGVATEATLAEVGEFRPGAWARALVEVVESESLLVLPGAPDGRDLAPRLAHALGRPLVSAAVRVAADHVVVARFDGQVEYEVALEHPAVVVMQPGVRTVVPRVEPITIAHLDLVVDTDRDAQVIEVLPADPATVDLAEADRVVAGGAGIGSSANLELLGRLGLHIGASLGATRVLTDAGWIPHQRQIGTTGVEIDPRFYLAVGISGAVQHLMGIGDPDHVIAVNTDGSCPMMHRADIAIVTDGPAYVVELARRLGVDGTEPAEGVRTDPAPDETTQVRA